MKLDKSKKYEFCGEVYEWDIGEGWVTDALHSSTWSMAEMEFFNDKGLITEVREPLVFEGEVKFFESGNSTAFGYLDYRELPCGPRIGKTFKVTWTEVVE